ncbi:MAG: prolipoprotein diacylglyceryl transferase [Candidatus Marinimicrobia bacterium]|nr:prolipoprotein diacylglyceryl transferase [Candidatus Neomarinimicrobiota bacterium]
MHPDIVKIGPVTIHSFGLMMAIAFMAGYYILSWEVKRREEDSKIASDLIFWGAVGGIIGAKLFSVFENFADFLADPLHTLFSGSGFVFHGGLMGGTISVVTILYLRKKPIGTYADIAGPIILVGQGIGRIGCLLAGCCHGSCTTSFASIQYPAGSQASYYQYHNHLLDSAFMKSLPVHPTPLYETVLNFTMAFLIIKFIRPGLKKRGTSFGIAIIYAGLIRFLLEFIRINPKTLWGLTNYQFSSIFFVLLGVFVLLFLAKTEKEDFEIGK